MRLAPAAALILLSLAAIPGLAAQAKSFVPSSAYLKAKMGPPPAKSPWTHNILYGFGSDYADRRKPRAYDHILAGTVSYDFDKRWSLGLDAGLRYTMIDGQIPKEEQQTYAETVNPSTELALGYGEDLGYRSYQINIHGEPLWTEDARREGHQGLIGTAGEMKINFFKKRYTMSHIVDGTSLINTYHYGSDKRANPDYFWTYKWKNDLRFLRTWKVSYSFGAKMTRYLDGFIGYSYNNTMSISKAWNSLSVAASYDNGGFTDDGYVRLWYVDQYRRIVRLAMAYSF